MFKNLFISALVAAAAIAAPAQETLYLIKGNKVVAKYSINDVDYASFKLPDGVQDLDPADDPTVTNITYLGATGSYFGTTDGVANFQIQLSSGDVGDESFPRSMLYLQFMSNAADYNNLKFEDGTYTPGDNKTLEPFKFHPGISETVDGQVGIGGTFNVILHTGDDVVTELVESGSFTITTIDNGYKLAGVLVLDNANVINFNYQGAIMISNESDEKDAADELPLPESTMTGDVEFTAKAGEVYANVWSKFFHDEPRFDYVNLQIYGDNNYERCLQLGLIVDTEKSGGVKLPKGTYPIIKRTASEFAAHDMAALPAWAVASETTNFAPYGCWYITNYDKYSPLLTGEVEVLEDSDLNSMNIRVTLSDPDGHKITCTYNGAVDFF